MVLQAIAVLGATGQQGDAVVRFGRDFLRHGGRDHSPGFEARLRQMSCEPRGDSYCAQRCLSARPLCCLPRIARRDRSQCPRRSVCGVSTTKIIEA